LNAVQRLAVPRGSLPASFGALSGCVLRVDPDAWGVRTRGEPGVIPIDGSRRGRQP